MYNGVGVSSARGTGTSGHVERNLSYVNPAAGVTKWKVEKKAVIPSSPEELDPRLALHEQKRRLELQLLPLRERLEDSGLSDDAIEAQLDMERARLQESGPGVESEDFAQIVRNAKAAVAFGVHR